jgi:hypothetical protein
MCESLTSSKSDCLAKRDTAVEGAKEYIGSADVEVGATESAYISTYNSDTGKVTTRVGNDAANRTNDGAQFTDGDGNVLQTDKGSDGRISGTNDIVLATGHSHPKAYGPDNDKYKQDAISLKVDGMNERIDQNINDTALSKMAPLIIKVPSSTVRVFRNGKEVNP